MPSLGAIDCERGLSRLSGRRVDWGGGACVVCPRGIDAPATAYAVPVAILTFKVIQDQRFSCHLKGNMRLPISVVILSLSLLVSGIRPVFN